MYKNQLQELAQRSCFNLPSYSCIREGPDHAPRFKATVNFNGEAFESPCFCSTLRQAEHAAAEVALNTLAIRGPSRALAARVLDETGVYKNLLQETAHRAGLNLPVYTTIRSGPGHVPVFSCTVELAGMSFTGEPARTKKQAQKNAAMAAWSSLKRLAQQGSPSSPSPETKVNEEQEQVIVARLLTSLLSSETTRSFVPTDPQNGKHHHTNIPICTKSTLPEASSLCAMQFHNWPYPPSYSPEIAMYQLWQPEQLLHHHHCLFQLPISPGTPSMPPLFPFVQSVIHPDHCLYFPGINHHESTSFGPRFTIAASSSSLRGRSTVTIQEIQEDKPEDSPAVAEPSSRVIPEPAQENIQRTNNVGERAYPATIDSRFEPPVDFQLPSPSPCGFDSSRVINPGQGQQYPPRVGSPRNLRPMTGAPPVTIRTMGPQNPLTQFPMPPRMRTGGPSCSPRPVPGRMDLRGVRHSFMAPAVRIRSVVPVCSAPPPRKTPGSGHEGPSPRPENKDRDHQANLSKASSELEKLEL